jgi:hypothetical protein
MKLNISIKNILLIGLLASLNTAFAKTPKEEYLEVVQHFLMPDQYAYRYDVSLIGNDGKKTQLTDESSVMLRNHLSLFSISKRLEYLINTEGTLMVNHESKKITVSYNPYTEEELKVLKDNLNTEMSEKLVEAVNQCDSIARTTINNFIVYTMYVSDGEYRKTECWTNQHGDIQEVRYYYSDGDYLYERIVYTPVDIHSYLDNTAFSHYVKIEGEKFIPVSNYKNYELIIGN